MTVNKPAFHVIFICFITTSSGAYEQEGMSRSSLENLNTALDQWISHNSQIRTYHHGHGPSNGHGHSPSNGQGHSNGYGFAPLIIPTALNSPPKQAKYLGRASLIENNPPKSEAEKSQKTDNLPSRDDGKDRSPDTNSLPPINSGEESNQETDSLPPNNPSNPAEDEDIIQDKDGFLSKSPGEASKGQETDGSPAKQKGEDRSQETDSLPDREQEIISSDIPKMSNHVVNQIYNSKEPNLQSNIIKHVPATSSEESEPLNLEVYSDSRSKEADVLISGRNQKFETNNRVAQPHKNMRQEVKSKSGQMKPNLDYVRPRKRPAPLDRRNRKYSHKNNNKIFRISDPALHRHGYLKKHYLHAQKYKPRPSILLIVTTEPTTQPPVKYLQDQIKIISDSEELINGNKSSNPNKANGDMQPQSGVEVVSDSKEAVFNISPYPEVEDEESYPNIVTPGKISDRWGSNGLNTPEEPEPTTTIESTTTHLRNGNETANEVIPSTPSTIPTSELPLDVTESTSLSESEYTVETTNLEGSERESRSPTPYQNGTTKSNEISTSEAPLSSTWSSENVSVVSKDENISSNANVQTTESPSVSLSTAYPRSQFSTLHSSEFEATSANTNGEMATPLSVTEILSTRLDSRTSAPVTEMLSTASEGKTTEQVTEMSSTVSEGKTTELVPYISSTVSEGKMTEPVSYISSTISEGKTTGPVPNMSSIVSEGKMTEPVINMSSTNQDGTRY